MHLTTLKRALASVLLVSTNLGLASAKGMTQPTQIDIAKVAATSLVPVKDGAVAGEPFRADELWKDVPADEAVIIHVVRRPG